MDAQDASDPQQGRDARVYRAGFDILVGLAGHAGGEEHALLRPVLTEAFDADTVTDSASAFDQPGVVIGQVGHPSDTRPMMIISQPGKPGIL